ncbi:hypothetical protein NONO_c26440 [Nocardia nova SH22a]|uniref:Methyltransferase n=1 Tax=Nocardia nova SH22a TaxID=1415166 RepID=W5TJL0_9NOCA|nr:class I SAM-dependent methyltransferase [Nocardia nova]AHH17436.1 hypothetical protein NONO_c26440 [Nocardia nova SH22a]
MNSSGTTDDELAGARPYTRAMLATYDLWVLGFNNHLVWRCPTRHLLRLYDNVSDRHLDIGPGSGWHLRHARFPSPKSVVALVDLNEAPLAVTAGHLRRRGIETSTHIGSVLDELPVDRRFRSAATNLLMHCVPGGWQDKGVAFRHIANAMTDDGVYFGSTVLSLGVPHTRLSRITERQFQRLRAFHNQEDDPDGLRTALGQAFGTVDVRTIGSMALWTARDPLRE